MRAVPLGLCEAPNGRSDPAPEPRFLTVGVKGDDFQLIFSSGTLGNPRSRLTRDSGFQDRCS